MSFLSKPSPATPAGTTRVFPTAADAMALIAARPRLTARQRADQSSAMATLARWSGRGPTDMPLDPVLIREQVITRSPAAFKVKPGRKSNVVSSVTQAMCHMGLIDSVDVDVSAAWKAFLEPIDQHRCIPLMRFARFCTWKSITADAVTVETLNEFERHLTLRTLTQRPGKIVGAVRGLWNKCGDQIAGWPATKLVKPLNPKAYTKPLSAFTPAFRESLERFRGFLAATALDDPFDDIDAMSDSEDSWDDDADDQLPLPNRGPLREITIASYLDHTRWAASALVATGVAIDMINDVSDLMIPVDRPRSR